MISGALRPFGNYSMLLDSVLKNQDLEESTTIEINDYLIHPKTGNQLNVIKKKKN